MKGRKRPALVLATILASGLVACGPVVLIGAGVGIGVASDDDDDDPPVVFAGSSALVLPYLLTFDSSGSSGGALGPGAVAAIGDLDRDGFPDLVVGDAGITVHLLLGSGRLRPATQSSDPGGRVGALALGDVDRDGDLDLVLAVNGLGGRIWRNDGAGLFSDTALTLSPLAAASRLHLSDVDRDGDLDLVSLVSGGVQIWLGDGSGGFTPGESFGSGVADVAVGDLDGDARPDVVSVSASGSSSHAVWFGRAGGFSEQVFDMGPATSVVAGDVDSDGDLDVVVGRVGRPPDVWRNDGAGGLAFLASVPGLSGAVVALADADADADLDLFLAGRVARNDGSGTFEALPPPGGNPLALAVGDLDADGDHDQAVVVGGVLQTLITCAEVFAPIPEPRSFLAAQTVLGDVNGDGDLDALSGGWILTNSGLGVFERTQQLTTEFGAVGRLGDVDGDGDLDAVWGSFSSLTQVWINDGSGAFVDGGQRLADSNLVALYLEDVDRDGDPDLVSVSDVDETIRVRLNVGGVFESSGQLLTAPSFKRPPRADLLLVDMDRDGDLDLLDLRTTGIHAWENNGQGLFNERGEVIEASYTGERMAAADLDGDGNVDLLVSGSTRRGGPTPWTFMPGEPLPGREFYYRMLETGDVDGDGDLDVLIVMNDELVIALNDGRGAFPLQSRPLPLGSASFFNALALGDLNGDGAIDVVLAGDSYRNTRACAGQDLSFVSAGQALGSGSVRAEALGDVDGDGDLDLLTGLRGAGNPLYVNSGQAAFVASGQALGASNTDGLALGDLDGDGDLDLFESVDNLGDRVWRNDGNGVFTDTGQSLTVPATSDQTGDATVVDIDGDGDRDVLAVTSGLQVWRNDGAGSLSLSGSFTIANHYPRLLRVGDLDGDGDVDAVTADSASVRVWRNDGTGTFAATGQSFANSWTRSLALGDLDGDGDQDLIVSHSQDTQVLFNSGDGTFAAQAIDISVAGNIALGDLDGDGDLDVVLADTVLRVWMNLGGTFADSGLYLRATDTDSYTSVQVGDVNGDGSPDLVTSSTGSTPSRVFINQR